MLRRVAWRPGGRLLRAAIILLALGVDLKLFMLGVVAGLALLTALHDLQTAGGRPGRRGCAFTEDGDENLSEFRTVMLLSARRRVRRALGFPPDEFDDSPLLPPPAE